MSKNFGSFHFSLEFGTNILKGFQKIFETTKESEALALLPFWVTFYPILCEDTSRVTTPHFQIAVLSGMVTAKHSFRPVSHYLILCTH